MVKRTRARMGRKGGDAGVYPYRGRLFAGLVGFLVMYQTLFGISLTHESSMTLVDEQSQASRNVLTTERKQHFMIRKARTIGRRASSEEETPNAMKPTPELSSPVRRKMTITRETASKETEGGSTFPPSMEAETTAREIRYAWRPRGEGVGKHFFSFGPKQDRIASFSPACIEPGTEKLVVFDSPRVCSGYNHTFDWWVKMCDFMEKEFHTKESAFGAPAAESLDSMKEWSEGGRVRVVPGVTVLQKLLRDCGNIAHFSGRILALNHLLGNLATYGIQNVDNVLLAPGEDVMKRFLKPLKYSSWHQAVLEAIVLPEKVAYNVTFREFLEKQDKTGDTETPRVHVLHDLVTSEYVCFEHLFVPGFLKARFFLMDDEYPSKEPSMRGSSPESPAIPRDSLRFRRNIRSVVFGEEAIPTMTKKIVYIDRAAQIGRRALDPSTRRGLFELIGNRAAKEGYIFEVVKFEGYPIKKQIRMVEDVAIVISVHGANLVNTIFQPPLAAMVELFPYGFNHKMYVEGGGAGIRYFSHEAVSGDEYDHLEKYSSREDCISKDHDCKIHYRDANLKFVDVDYEKLTEILDEAFKYLGK